jgi:hypothetical protein
MNHRGRRRIVLALGALFVLGTGIGVVLFDSEDQPEDISASLGDPDGTEAIAEWCINITSVVGPGGRVGSVAELASLIGTTDLADPPEDLPAEEREAWAAAHPDYVTTTFYVLLAGEPPDITDDYRTVADAVSAAHSGQPPPDVGPVLESARKVDGYIAEMC